MCVCVCVCCLLGRVLIFCLDVLCLLCVALRGGADMSDVYTYVCVCVCLTLRTCSSYDVFPVCVYV
jgi:hypothetical protein